MVVRMVLFALLGTPLFAAANFTLIIADGPRVGFNDPTPATPVGGNPGTSLYNSAATCLYGQCRSIVASSIATSVCRDAPQACSSIWDWTR